MTFDPHLLLVHLRMVGVAMAALVAVNLYVPRRPTTYLLFSVSTVLAIVVCFGCRFLVNAAAYWLLDARGRPVTEVGGQALHALRRALLEGNLSWWHAADDALEVLKLRNGIADGEDIAPGTVAEKGDSFHADVEEALDCLHVLMVPTKGLGR